MIGLLPNKVSGCRAEITAFRERLGSDPVLVTLRSLTDRWLLLWPFVGFRPHDIGCEHRTKRIQQNLVPHPPVTAP